MLCPPLLLLMHNDTDVLMQMRIRRQAHGGRATSLGVTNTSLDTPGVCYGLVSRRRSVCRSIHNWPFRTLPTPLATPHVVPYDTDTRRPNVLSLSRHVPRRPRGATQRVAPDEPRKRRADERHVVGCCEELGCVNSRSKCN